MYIETYQGEELQAGRVSATYGVRCTLLVFCHSNTMAWCCCNSKLATRATIEILLLYDNLSSVFVGLLLAPVRIASNLAIGLIASRPPQSCYGRQISLFVLSSSLQSFLHPRVTAIDSTHSLGLCLAESHQTSSKQQSIMAEVCEMIQSIAERPASDKEQHLTGFSRTAGSRSVCKPGQAEEDGFV
jgi:hypothetical protein